ncbi:GGDEF domain-containing protein [Bacillus thuringiensis]|uniref:sensor domain-containing protein n=2 Tax=Bacillus thuringiensis TaxID=1428 RepID=UPI000BF3C769|nr:GGDEF domain-containing protein [Bacillus thuringiensis]PFD29033.1 GGDEF domain-containing protein [Bacillus thuringiensis]PFV75325.1 GGDEF domain-containing protein [Bacillus thuringiensis]PGL20089.1 GGDEF domain-containing protein [Bacillus thuringiensis]PGQ33578.1 GGDEF domain-containing protein [Bacillus thuringiensis]
MNALHKHLNIQFYVLSITFVVYIIFCFTFLFLFPNQYFVSDFNTRVSFLIIESIVFISLLYSILSKQINPEVFWIYITIAIGCFLISNLVVIFHPINVQLALQNFKISNVFLFLFLFFFVFAFCYKIIKDCNKWEKLYLICDMCIIVTAIFTLEWYIFNKPTVNILFFSTRDVFLTFIFPIIDLLFFLLGISLIFRPTVFDAKRKLYIFIIVLIGLSITDYLYFYLQDVLSYRSIILLKCLHRSLLLLIAIAANITKDAPSRRNYHIVKPMFGEKLLAVLPYLIVALLIGFTIKEQTSSSILILGNCITFTFVLIRQIIVRIQNRDLTEKLKVFNNQLEQKISQRTADLIKKSNELVAKQQKFKSLYEYHPDPILTIDLYGIILNVNQSGSMLLEKTSSELIGRDCFSIFLNKDKMKLKSAIQQAKKGHSNSLQLKVKNNIEKNIYFWYVTIVPIMIEGQTFGSYVMVKDITKIKEQQEEINYLAFHDTVTEIGNRIFFQQELEKSIEQAQKIQNQFGLLYIDLNRFKTINDALGHSIGDRVLKEVSKRFRACLLPTTPLARIGGDEFAIIVHNHTEQQMLDLCQTLFRITEEPFVVNQHSFYLSLSIGIAVYPFGGINTTTLLQHADIAMYSAKEKGNNAICIYDETLSQKIKRRLRLEQDLPNAIENNELFLLYQPQVESKAGKVIGAEALIRWKHPELGVISPFEFIPIAEEMSQIISIGKWTLQQACRQLKEWHSAGYSNLKMGINLSAIEFEQKDFVQTIISTIEEVGVPANSIDLELTERIAMVDEKETLSKLKALKSYGIHLSIDDFGTGYSSLAYLPLYPIDTLKIPREFVNRIRISNDGEEIIQTIISLAHTLKMKVIAEGVETKEQLAVLQRNSCYLIQGYYYSKPVNEEEFICFLIRVNS